MHHDLRLQRALQQLAEQVVPDDVDLWPALQARLRSDDQGAFRMNTPLRQRRRPWLALSIAMALLGLAALLLTPQGLALAQRLWLFFTPAAEPAFPVPASAGAPDALAPTAEPPAGLAGCEGLTGAAAMTCQAEQAEAALGFDLRTPTADLPGLEFVYGQVNADQRVATLVYNAVGGGAGLSISQGRGDLDSVVWEQVPAEAAVEKVTINGFEGEYVRGTFVVYAGAAEAVWNPDAPVQRLRWREGGTVYEISLMGEVEAVEYLDQAGLIALAESLR